MSRFLSHRGGSMSALAFVAALLFLAGCSGDDNPTGPTQTVELSGADAQEWTVQVLDMINAMSINVDDWATGSFTGLDMGGVGKAGEEPTYNPETMAWTLHYEGPLAEMEPPDYFNLTLDYYLQFRDEMGDPVMSPENAASYVARVAMGFDAHAEDQGNVSDMAYSFVTEMEVSGLGTSVYFVDGSGNSAVEVDVRNGEQWARMAFAMSWAMGLSVPADGGCPSGAAEVHAGDYHLYAAYDGTGNADWTLTGPGYQSGGTEPMDCGAPVAIWDAPDHQ